jgi:hypothetical protein
MFENEKEFEFNVCYDLKNKGISFKLLEEPFDLKINNIFIEFKKFQYDPNYHEQTIKFTEKQTKAMREGNIPIVLACAKDGFYLLSQEKVKDLINRPGRKDQKTVWITEDKIEAPKVSYEKILEDLIIKLKSLTK